MTPKTQNTHEPGETLEGLLEKQSQDRQALTRKDYFTRQALTRIDYFTRQALTRKDYITRLYQDYITLLEKQSQDT